VNLIFANRKLLSGPVLVSKIGNAGWTEPVFKVSKQCLIDTTKEWTEWRQKESGHGTRNPLRNV